MVQIYGDPFYLLGTQRSGTTWVSNVLNRSRDVLFFFEPFERNLGFFDLFPDESISISKPSASIINLFRHQHYNMIELNRRYFPADSRARLIVAKWVDMGCKNRWSRIMPHRRYKQLSVINQWHSEKIVEHLISKKSALRPLIKETRLHLKLQVIDKSFPHSRILLVLRHPYPVALSTLRWLARGRLEETKNKLNYIFDVYRTQEAVMRGCPEAVRCGLEGDLKQKLVAHWFILNDFALKTIQLLPDQSKIKVITYESICKEPCGAFEELFAFFSLEFGDEIKRYVHDTSASREEGLGIVDTKKSSSQIYDRWRKEPIDSNIARCIDKLAPYSEAYARVQQEYGSSSVRSRSAGLDEL